jgi:S-adenosylmethionine:tRNA ribosyltransferase-isomerase
MKTSQFNFHLPEELLAMHPATHRDESRLMVLNRKTETIEHRLFKDVIEYFDEGDLFVFNNTKVFPARLFGNKEKTGAKIEVFLLRELDKETRVWDVLVDPARKIRIGNKLFFTEDESLVAEVIDNTTSRGRTLRFLYDGSYEEFRKKLNDLGETPLPKFFDRPVEPEDAERFQTIHAKVEGAVAAPTAGLHFSKHLLKRMEIKGIDFSEITLHVGLGTFNPIEVEDLSKHKMESEEAFIDEKNAEIINKAVDEQRRISAVGTTTMST